MRKTRSDSVLLHLPEEQQAQLAEWLLSGVPYHKARELVEKEFGVAVRSLSSFGQFYDAVCRAHLLTRRARAVMTAEEVATAASVTPGRLDEATIAALKQKAFELAISPGQDPEAVKAVFSLVLKARDQDLDAEKLRLDRQKFEKDFTVSAMEHVETIKNIKGDSKLDSDQKIAAVRKVLFGMVAPS
jgi:hypothetical protein